jgi:hypothetical protein
MRVTYEKVDVPDFGGPEEIPSIPPSVYRDRLLRLQERMKAAELDVLVVYADREHSANLAYLTGFDPRFEEALFVFTADGQRTLIVGNECRGILGRLPIQAEIMLCQEFSLMGQDRSISWDLRLLLPPSGIRPGARCGTIGWKSLRAGRVEVPHYVVRLVEETSGRPPVNANDLLMSAVNGMRLFNEPEQIALYEYAGVRTSESVLALLRGLRPGIRGFEAARLYDSGGLPLSCHPMLAFGPEIPNGMASPANDRLAEGDRLTCAFGVWGSLTCRAGLAIRDARGLATSDGEMHWKVVENYLRVTRAWYRSVCVGIAAGEVWRAVEAERDDDLYTFCVNPGHYIHLDEWLSSPFHQGSTARLPAAAALQADIIPVGRPASVSVNMEDGIALADGALRRELAARYPDLYARCAARRRFMQAVLGYELSEDILPLGNIPGVYFPFLLDTGWMCRFEA